MIDENKLIEDLKAKIYPEKFGERCNAKDVISGVLQVISEQSKADWIPCEVEMPKEHDSMFAKLKGTDKWSSGMFEKISDEVNVTIELQDGSRITRTSNTIDGKWEIETNPWLKQKVIAWQSLPQPYKKEGNSNENT